MDANGNRNGHERSVTDAQPDFLALTHGQEWVQFYESFDKLVQDNLSRSSELLRKAMTLPEVADREVAQIKTEMEAKLSAERQRQQGVLTLLRDDVGSSHRQVSTLARSIGSIIADLERLSTRVVNALAVYDESVEEEVAIRSEALSDVAAAIADNVPQAAAAPAIQNIAAPLSAFSQRSIAAPATPTSAAAEEAPVSVDVKPFVLDEVDAQGAAENSLDVAMSAIDATPIDLSALADAEAAASDEGSQVGVAEIVDAPVEQPVAAGMSSERPRPHWLSVTRIGNEQR